MEPNGGTARLVRDYYDANKKRIRVEVMSMYLGTLLLGLGIFRPTQQGITYDEVIYSLAYAVGALIAVTLVLCLLHLLTALSVIHPLAKERGLSISQYLASEYYVVHCLPKLKQPDARKFW